ncbi:MAG TPA: hypothetical protein VL860_13170, partial [Planctomycetota bacterium]|nr:hypothetical protein [Planctomycetota bacterium]
MRHLVHAYYLLLTLAAAALWVDPLFGGDARPGLIHPAPLQASGGIEIDLRFPLGPYIRPGCRWPLEVRLKSTSVQRFRLGVVPELWQIDAQSGTFDPKAPPTVDFTQATGGSWSEVLRIGTVAGPDVAERVEQLLPVVDDARRHLVVVALDDESGRTGTVLWRGDLGKYLHELSADQRLVVRGHAEADWKDGAPEAAGSGPGGADAEAARTNDLAGIVEIPSTVTLPDQSTATPMLVDAWIGNFPEAAAAWQAVDLVVLDDRVFEYYALVQSRPMSSGVRTAKPGELSVTQGRALVSYAAQGGQVIAIEANDTEQLRAVAWAGRDPDPTIGESIPGIRHSFHAAGEWREAPAGRTLILPAEQLQQIGLPPSACAQFPGVPVPVGFGRVLLLWPNPPPLLSAPTGEGANSGTGIARVNFDRLFAEALAAREPRLQPRKRIDSDAYTQVFDPQTTRIPARLIGQIWWFLAAVCASLLAISVMVLRRSTATIKTSSRQWGSWSFGAGALVVVAGVASLYGSRSRLSAIEWRFAYRAQDGRGSEQRFTYVNALRTVGGVRMEPRAVPGATTAPVDGVALAATQRDIAVEPGRHSALADGKLEGFTLESYRPLLLRSTWPPPPAVQPPSQANANQPPLQPKSVVTGLGAGGTPVLHLAPAIEQLRAAADWGILLDAYPATQGPPHLPTDHTG